MFRCVRRETLHFLRFLGLENYGRLQCSAFQTFVAKGNHSCCSILFDISLVAFTHSVWKLAQEDAFSCVSLLTNVHLSLVTLFCRILYDKRFSAFHYPVTDEDAPNYRSIIQNPMDVATLLQRVDSGHYITCPAFLQDVDLILSNAKVCKLWFLAEICSFLDDAYCAITQVWKCSSFPQCLYFAFFWMRELPQNCLCTWSLS